jgi:hypothetical protein
MGLNIDQIRKRLNTLKSQTKKTSNIWKPEPGKSKIRIVPYKYQPGNPFVELYFHYAFGGKGKRSYLSLKTFGEKDPIVDFCEKLKRTGLKEDWLMGVKHEPKLRTFAPIVVRGKEQEGVKFWGFGKQIYEKLLAVAENEAEWGDITDPVSGHDIQVEFKSKEEVGKDYPETDIQVLPSITPLSKDDALVAKLLDEQKEIFEVFPKPTVDELKEVLNKFLNPEETEEETAEGEESAEEGETDTKPTPKIAAKPAVKEGKEDVKQAFDKLFKDADAAK